MEEEFKRASELEPYVPATREERLRVLWEVIKEHPEGLHLNRLIGRICFKWGLTRETAVDYLITLERAGLTRVYNFRVYPR